MDAQCVWFGVWVRVCFIYCACMLCLFYSRTIAHRANVICCTCTRLWIKFILPYLILSIFTWQIDFSANCSYTHERVFGVITDSGKGWAIIIKPPGTDWSKDDDVIKWKHFCVTGLLCGECTGHRWIPFTITKASDAELWCFLLSAPEQTAEQTIETPVIW